MAVKSKRETILEYLRNTTMPLINGVGHYNLELSIKLHISYAIFQFHILIL